MSAEAKAPATKSAKRSVAEGRRELQDLIRTSKAVEERRLNPFHMDVGESLDLADRFFDLWETFPDLMLDAKALNALSRVVKLQESRLRYQAQLFHADPEAMAEKLKSFKTDTLFKAFLQCWHPVTELEQVTPQALEEAAEYWETLLPVAERRRERPRTQAPAMEELTLDDLLARGVLARDGFGSELATLWDELKTRGDVDYWAFIEAPSHAERIRRAYATSYLVTYGYAWLGEENGAKDGAKKLVLHPRAAQQAPTDSVSMPIVVLR